MTTPANLHLTAQLKDRLLVELSQDPEAVWGADVAAAFLGVSPDTLRRWRRTGEGPQYVRLSKTKMGYQKQSLRAWVLTRAYQSTAEASAADTISPEGVP